MKRICVFCGSNSGTRFAYIEAARTLGRILVRNGIGLVYGGGCVGLMGEIADTVMSEGGEVTGVIPQTLVAREVAHRGITELTIVKSMHERKARMADLADGFIALPGGYGTFEEFFEVITWAQLGLHRKPCGILNVEGYYDPLLALIERGVAEQFVHPANRDLILQSTDPEALLKLMQSYRPKTVEKWIDKDES